MHFKHFISYWHSLLVGVCNLTNCQILVL